MFPIADVVPMRTAPKVTVALLVVSTAAWFLRAVADVDLPARLLASDGIALHAASLLVLWAFGPAVEDRLGHLRFLALYLCCAAAGVAADGWASPTTPPISLGAIASIAGLFGAYLGLFTVSRVLLLLPLVVYSDVVEIPSWFVMGFWLIVSLTAGLARHPDAPTLQLLFWIHAGGLVAGLGGQWLLRRPDRMRVEWWDSDRG